MSSSTGKFAGMVKEGLRPVLMNRLPVMDQVKASGHGFYGAAAGEAGLDPVEEFMCESWLADLEANRAQAGVSAWLP